MPNSELEYYRSQLAETRKLSEADPLNSDLNEIIKQLETKVADLESKSEEDDIQLGRACEVFYEGKWFNAEVHSHHESPSGEIKVIVRLLGTEQGREYNLSDIRFLPKAKGDEFTAGMKVQAIWKEDGLWYPATVRTYTEDGSFIVSFDGFDGEPEEVKADQVRKPLILTGVGKQKPKAEEKTYTTPAGYIIPEKLKIDPTKDTQAVIESKKRKIHVIKSQQRNEKHTAVALESKNKWQSFQQKLGKK
jgi:hypothetical protein